MNEIDVVVDVRQSPDTAEIIVSKQKVVFNGDACLVGSPVESRIGLFTRKAQVSLFTFAEEGSDTVVAASVKNVGAAPFEISRVVFETRYQQPPSVQLGSVAAHEPGSVGLYPRHAEKKGPLQPGEEREYYLPPCMYDGLALVAASLPPAQFWIAAYSGEEEVGRVRGEYIRPFFDRSRIVFHRRALPLFDTLPEEDRLALIRAVASLRGMERDQWPSAGAEPLDGVPLTFVLRANEELGVIVTPTEDKGVEIVDIVRPATLDQFDLPGEGSK